MKTPTVLDAFKIGQKKFFIAICLLFFTSFFAYAQNWENAGAPFCGFRGGYVSYLASLSVYNGKLYAGGENISNGIVYNIGSWNGTQWDSLGSENNSFNNNLITYAMTEYNGALYLGGAYSIEKWDGSNFVFIDVSIHISIKTMTEYNGSLYVGGSFDSIGGIAAHNIARWNGTNWSAVGNGINGYVDAMAVGNGNVLYVGGSFDSAGTTVAHNIAEWNGSNWSAFGGGIPNGSKLIKSHFGTSSAIYSVNALCSNNGNLYVGGFFDTTGTGAASNIACWNGLYWATLGNGLTIPGDSTYDAVYALYEYNNVLYAGGAFTHAGSLKVNGIAQWNGTAWAGLGNGVTGVGSPSVDAITVYNNSLYIDGIFDSAGTIRSCCLAEWNMPLAVNEISNINSISVYPNPSNGLFTIISSGHSAPNETNISSINVYNVLGEKIISTNNVKWSNAASNNSFQTSIDLSSQTSGIYFYKIINQNGIVAATGKLVKE